MFCLKNKLMETGIMGSWFNCITGAFMYVFYIYLCVCILFIYLLSLCLSLSASFSLNGVYIHTRAPDCAYSDSDWFCVAEIIRPYASRTGLTGSSVPPVLYITWYRDVYIYILVPTWHRSTGSFDNTSHRFHLYVFLVLIVLFLIRSSLPLYENTVNSTKPQYFL